MFRKQYNPEINHYDQPEIDFEDSFDNLPVPGITPTELQRRYCAGDEHFLQGIEDQIRAANGFENLLKLQTKVFKNLSKS